MPRGRQPKYLAIYADLRNRILEGTFAPGQQLPSQQDLATEFGVTIMTLRQAIAELEAEGLIWVSRGRGSFVVDQPLRVRIGNLTSFAQQVTAQGMELETRVLSIGSPTTGVTDARAALGRARGPLTEVHRIRRVDGRPVVSQRTVMSADLADQLDLDHLARRSLYEMILATVGYRVDRARETLRAVVLADPDADLLERPPGSAALLSLRTSFSTDSTPFLFDRALLVGEAASIEADRHVDRLELSYNVRSERRA